MCGEVWDWWRSRKSLPRRISYLESAMEDLEGNPALRSTTPRSDVIPRTASKEG